jgi:hypothetical protein
VFCLPDQVFARSESDFQPEFANIVRKLAANIFRRIETQPG